MSTDSGSFGNASARLTESQQRAVEHKDGPLLVLAGPGSGKTRVITHRIARLVHCGVQPGQLLALTFTNKAAREMGERVERLLGAGRVRVSTFHKFCSQLLRRWPSAVGLKENFTILDQPDQVQLVREIMKEERLDTVFHDPARVLSRISRARNDMISSAEFQRQFEQRPGNPLEAIVYTVFPLYEQRVLNQNSVDFDDLLLHVVRLLDEDGPLRTQLDDRFRYILVDEYQDTNLAQYRIVRLLSHDHPNLCVTGDPDQSIYGWRGARPANIAAFERDFPQRVVVELNENFRSTQHIVRCADQLIAQNPRPHRGPLVTANAEGEAVRLLIFEHGDAEADGIAREIADEVAAGRRKYSDCAVFYRVNALSRGLESALARHRVPYQVAAGYSFFERTEVRDLIAWLRLIENPSDDVACERIINRPPRGIGEGTVAKLRKHAAQWGGSLLDAARQADRVTGLSGRAKKAVSGFADLIGRLQEQSASGRVAPLLERLLAEIDYLSLWREDSDDVDVDRAANVFELVAAARLYDASAEAPDAIADPPSLQGFLELATLSNEADNVDPARGAVTLMTLHASKGLEFPCVWIIGLEQGLIPHERAVRDGNPASFEEERRLLFVGITRAQQQLTLTQASERVFRGQRRTSISSPFLPELNGTFQQHASIETPPAITAALLDERIEQARRRFHAARREPDRPLIVTASELAARQAAARPNVASDSTSTTEASDSTAAEPASTTPPSLLNIQRVDTAHGAADSDATDELRSPFRPGMLVRHPQYGRGTVTACSGMSNRRTVTVCFDNSNEPKTFVAAHCPLQPAGPPIDF